jgi:hypothetical protein
MYNVIVLEKASRGYRRVILDANLDYLSATEKLDGYIASMPGSFLLIEEA